MIITLTPNPSVDLLFTADRLAWDDANRLAPPRRRAGGQGLNLVRVLRSLEPSADAVAVAALGGAVGRELAGMLERDPPVPLRPVPVAGETRVFVGVRERATGRSLLLNPRGPAVDAAAAGALLEAVDAAMRGARTGGGGGAHGGWVVCCGSLLPGLPADLYARAGRRARDAGFRFVADCDGEALAAAAPLCDLLAPNAHEASRLAGVDVTDPPSALRAARRLHERGTTTVAVTLGEAGAVGTSTHGAWHARPALPANLAVEAAEGSAVGAGDAFLAAFLLALRSPEDLAAALADGVAAGTAALLGRGADLVRSEDAARVRRHVVVDRLG